MRRRDTAHTLACTAPVTVCAHPDASCQRHSCPSTPIRCTAANGAINQSAPRAHGHHVTQEGMHGVRRQTVRPCITMQAGRQAVEPRFALCASSRKSAPVEPLNAQCSPRLQAQPAARRYTPHGLPNPGPQITRPVPARSLRLSLLCSCGTGSSSHHHPEGRPPPPPGSPLSCGAVPSKRTAAAAAAVPQLLCGTSHTVPSVMNAVPKRTRVHIRSASSVVVTPVSAVNVQCLPCR